MTLKLTKTVGNYVEGDRFWGRERELKLLIQDLDDGANLLLVAQRRIGKTSLMHEASRLIQDRYQCLHVDLQQSSSAADAIAELGAATKAHDNLWQKTKDIFVNVVRGVHDQIDSLQVADVKVTLRSALTEADWQSKGDRLLAELAKEKKPVVLFLDEVPILVNRMLKDDNFEITPDRRRQVDQFMSWLRANSIKHQGKIRIVVTGSIGLEPVLRQAGLSATVNHFSPFELGPWSSQTAKGCIEALANNYEITFETGAIETMLMRMGICIPYHVQLFFKQVHQHCTLEDIQSVTTELVEHIYATKMLSVRGHAELSHLEERLKLVLGPKLHSLALELLTEAAVVESLSLKATEIIGEEYLRAVEEINEDDHCREVLTILEHDGYLQPDAQGDYRFVSKLIQDWWKARYQFNFIPALKRV